MFLRLLLASGPLLCFDHAGTDDPGRVWMFTGSGLLAVLCAHQIYFAAGYICEEIIQSVVVYRGRGVVLLDVICPLGQGCLGTNIYRASSVNTTATKVAFRCRRPRASGVSHVLLLSTNFLHIQGLPLILKLQQLFYPPLASSLLQSFFSYPFCPAALAWFSSRPPFRLFCFPAALAPRLCTFSRQT